MPRSHARQRSRYAPASNMSLDVQTGDVPWRGVRAWCRAGSASGVYAGMSWAGVTSLAVAVSKAMEPSDR
jgi:hypothetical protein